MSGEAILARRKLGDPFVEVLLPGLAEVGIGLCDSFVLGFCLVYLLTAEECAEACTCECSEETADHKPTENAPHSPSQEPEEHGQANTSDNAADDLRPLCLDSSPPTHASLLHHVSKLVSE